jgi:ribonuclease Z
MQVNKIFITHYHGDHFLGLPGLIQSMYLNERDEELNIYGPEGTENFISTLLKLGYFTPSFDIYLHDIKSGDETRFDGYKVSASKVEHNVPSLAYALEEDHRPGRFNKPRALELGVPEGRLFSKLQRGEPVEVNGKTITPDMVMGPTRPGRKFVYSGDTKPCDAMVKLARNCDVLIHDSTFDEELEEKANRYGHSSSVQAARIAKEAGAKQLFLTHISPRYEDGELLETQARKIFENTEAARDMLEYEIKLEK